MTDGLRIPSKHTPSTTKATSCNRCNFSGVRVRRFVATSTTAPVAATYAMNNSAIRLILAHVMRRRWIVRTRGKQCESRASVDNSRERT